MLYYRQGVGGDKLVSDRQAQQLQTCKRGGVAGAVVKPAPNIVNVTKTRSYQSPLMMTSKATVPTTPTTPTTPASNQKQQSVDCKSCVFVKTSQGSFLILILVSKSRGRGEQIDFGRWSHKARLTQTFAASLSRVRFDRWWPH